MYFNRLPAHDHRLDVCERGGAGRRQIYMHNNKGREEPCKEAMKRSQKGQTAQT